MAGLNQRRKRKAITHGQSTDTGNIGHTRHIAKRNKTQNNTENKQMSNMDPTKNKAITHGLLVQILLITKTTTKQKHNVRAIPKSNKWRKIDTMNTHIGSRLFSELCTSTVIKKWQGT